MAYQQVGTPRFYINVIEWLDSIGFDTQVPAARYHTLPVVSYEMFGRDNPVFPENTFSRGQNDFYALLGHNISQNGENFTLASVTVPAASIGGGYNISDIINIASSPQYDGFSMASMDIPPETTTVETASSSSGNWQFHVGSIILGTFYDMPHSPDLSLSMSREYGGTKTIETRGGASLSNTMWTKSPQWQGKGAWELSSEGSPPNQELSRSGRRIWDLSFSYLDQGDVWGSNQMLNTLREDFSDGLDDADTGSGTSNYEYTLLTDNSFYSQVIHKTNGGQLPFIFQPDNANSNAQDFAICKFDQKSFQFNQTAPGLYNAKLKIRECW